jgi:hypothetical protein
MSNHEIAVLVYKTSIYFFGVTVESSIWAGYLPHTQEFLVLLTRQYSEEFARRFAAIIDEEKQQSSTVATHDVSDPNRQPPGG